MTPTGPQANHAVPQVPQLPPQPQVRYDPRLVLGVHFSANDRERAVDVPDSYASLLHKEDIQMQVLNDVGKVWIFISLNSTKIVGYLTWFLSPILLV